MVKQVIPKNIKPKEAKSTPKKTNGKKKHKDYGISKLEKTFATEFLDKRGLAYIYQYEAKDIKRFFDFALTANDTINYELVNKHGIKCVKQGDANFTIDLIIEVDGSYFHNDPRVVAEDKITRTHKRNMRVDKIKTRWCYEHHIPILRIWEYDIKHNPQQVLDEIDSYIKSARRKFEIKEGKRKPH